MELEAIIARLKELADPDAIAGMARYGINPDGALGVSIPELRSMAKEAGKDHDLAAKLWASGYHEARIMATLVDDPALVTERQMESWAAEFDSWDVVDQCMNNLFRKTPFAHGKAVEWSRREEEFVKRAGFVLIAALAVHDKEASDATFARYLPVIRRGATDERNFVKKAVNWALRQIGKRNPALNAEAIATAEKLATASSKAAKWVGRDALRELASEKVQERLHAKGA